MTQNTNTFRTKATLLLVSSLTVLSGATIAPALPTMQAHFASVENVEFWIRFVLTTPALFIVLMAPLAGLIVDRLGRKNCCCLRWCCMPLQEVPGSILNRWGPSWPDEPCWE